MFTNVPVIVNTFNVELRSGIDYISTRQNLPSSRRIINPNENRQFDQTYAPTLSLISCLVTPIYSRDSVSQFSLAEFARGQLQGNKNIPNKRNLSCLQMLMRAAVTLALYEYLLYLYEYVCLRVYTYLYVPVRTSTPYCKYLQVLYNGRATDLREANRQRSTNSKYFFRTRLCN